MFTYEEICHQVLTKGKFKNNRTGTRALTIANTVFQHDMSDGSFPLHPGRKLPIRSILVELEAFLRGVTDKRWFEERKCSYWSAWCNPDKFHYEMIEKHGVYYKNEFSKDELKEF